VFGRTCSSIPPCGVALFVLVAEAAVAAAVMVFVSIELTVTVAEAISRSPPQRSTWTVLDRQASHDELT
jgi:hypothetical protein